MHIVILGSGQVAYSLVDYLVDEDYDITVVDSDELAIKSLQLHFDLQGIIGHPCDPLILEKADVGHADFVISVTPNDEINMLACLVADKVFQTPTRIACIRNQHYLTNNALNIQKNLSIDIAFNPEQEVTNYIYQLILNPGVIETASFDHDCICMILLKIDEKMSIWGHQIKELNNLISDVYFIFAGLYRTDQGIIFSSKAYVEDQDEIYFVLKKEDIKNFLYALGHRSSKLSAKNIAIVGGGEIGSRLAQQLENKFNIKLIEKDRSQAEANAKNLDETMVLMGDATDSKLLAEESIQDADIFVAVTDSDEVNLLSAQFAKKIGVPEVISLLKRKDYLDLAEKSKAIDVIISPDHATLNRVLTNIHQSNVTACYALHHHNVQAIEIQVGSTIPHYLVKELALPQSIYIVAVIRKENLFQARRDFRIKNGDHIIAVVTDSAMIKQLEKIFKAN